MSDQNPNVELNKEEDKLIVENNSVEDMKNGPKAVKKPSALLSFSFLFGTYLYSSIYNSCFIYCSMGNFILDFSRS